MAEIKLTNVTELQAHLAKRKSVSRFDTDVTIARANLEGANLTRANLNSAYLTSANLEGAKMNWLSHNLIAERLRQAADKDVLLRLAAGYVFMSCDMCYRQLIANAPVIVHPEHGTVMAWALRQMASWRTDDDDFPEILAHAIANLEITKGE